jgi:opacity protein-like surface antigen
LRTNLRMAHLLFASLLGPAALLQAQATSTASRVADLQIGGGFSIGKSDYGEPKLIGGAAYIDFDPRSHFGAEFVIHQVNTTSQDGVYERTYEIGGRYFRTYGRLAPYVKVMYGRGVFNYPLVYDPSSQKYVAEANLAYNLVAAGAGADFRLTRRFNLRADYEYQRWFSFPPSGLTPQIVTFGVAYHFPGELRIR